jgi:hypothetical protein
MIKTEHHRAIIHRWGRKKFDQHREILEKHKEKGPAFRQAVDGLERMFRDGI